MTDSMIIDLFFARDEQALSECDKKYGQSLRRFAFRLTSDVECSEECVDDMRQIPGVRVPAELNRAVRERFSRGIGEYLRFHASAPLPDRSPVLDLGSYMDLYVE